MSAPKTPSLKDRFDKIANTYVQQFCAKHDRVFEFWISEDKDQPACLSGEYVMLDDIRYDIDNNVPKGKIWEWMDWCSEMTDYSVSFRNYLKMNV